MEKDIEKKMCSQVKITVDKLTFCFPSNWVVSKYDDWTFYRKHFCKMFDGIKAIDILAYSPQKKEAYLIEVKDYRHPDTQLPSPKLSELPLEVARKVTMTLAGLLPAKLNATDTKEKGEATNILSNCKKIHVFLEIYHSHNKITSETISYLQQKLEQILRPVDPHPKVIAISSAGGKMPTLPWTAT